MELILLSEKFLSVKKTSEVSWNELKPMVISHLNHYFEKNDEPILKENTKKGIVFLQLSLLYFLFKKFYVPATLTQLVPL